MMFTLELLINALFPRCRINIIDVLFITTTLSVFYICNIKRVNIISKRRDMIIKHNYFKLHLFWVVRITCYNLVAKNVKRCLKLVV